MIADLLQERNSGDSRPSICVSPDTQELGVTGFSEWSVCQQGDQLTLALDGPGTHTESRHGKCCCSPIPSPSGPSHCSMLCKLRVRYIFHLKCARCGVYLSSHSKTSLSV